MYGGSNLLQLKASPTSRGSPSFLQPHSARNHPNMREKAFGAFKSKLFRPCRKFLSVFKLGSKRRMLTRVLRYRRPHQPSSFMTPATRRSRIPALRSLFILRGQLKEMDRLSSLKSLSDAGLVNERLLYPSPATPLALARTSRRASKREARIEVEQEDAEDACRSFENYLVEMIVEEGKVRDLGDVEELLYCWKSLKCPVFIDLVCRFYAELCKDLFSGEEDTNVD